MIDWNPSYVFDQLFDDEERKKYFFENVCTPDWNEEQDAGRSLKEATETLVAQHPDWKEYIEAYYGRWPEMLGGPIQETVEILRALKNKNEYKIYALTNWSGELFPIALGMYDFLHWFDGRLVSGDEKMRKPFPEFYQLMIDRFELVPQQTVFIDDNLRNVKAAEQFGIQCIHFTSPQQLKENLEEKGVL